MSKLFKASCVAFLVCICSTIGLMAQGKKNSIMEEKLHLTQDIRIKATVAITMYDMTRVTAKGYFDADDNADYRYNMKVQLNAQRTEDYKSGTYASAGGNPEVAPADAPQFLKDYVDYYKTKRGYHPRSLGSNEGFSRTSALSLLNMPILAYAGEIRSAVLLVHGEKAHSRYFSESVYKKLTGDNKQLLIIPNAVHTDLYDHLDVIPFDAIDTFFKNAFAVE